jgi:SAM-dependent methyltransferase
MRLFPNAKRAKARLLCEFEGKRILDVGCGAAKTPGAIGIDRRPWPTRPSEVQRDIDHDLTIFPWPIEDSSFDLVICSHVMEHLPDTVKTMEELNRITRSRGKVYIEVPHYTWFESFRHYEHKHFFTVGSFDYFVKGNPHYKTDFTIVDKYIFFDDLAYLTGVGFLANAFQRLYEKRFGFIFPATSFFVVLQVDKGE